MSQATESDVREDGVIESVSGPVVTAADLDARMTDVHDVVHPGVEVGRGDDRSRDALDYAVLSDV